MRRCGAIPGSVLAKLPEPDQATFGRSRPPVPLRRLQYVREDYSAVLRAVAANSSKEARCWPFGGRFVGDLSTQTTTAFWCRNCMYCTY